MNSRNPAVKRLLKEYSTLSKSNDEEFAAFPISENDVFDWHFVISGPPDTIYAGGLYHGRIVFPAEYPFKPPSFSLLTPNGRFETNINICLSISGYHPETWLPAWEVRTALIALTSLLPTKNDGSIGSISTPDHITQDLAKKSTAWTCPRCRKSNLELMDGKIQKPPNHTKSSLSLDNTIKVGNIPSVSKVENGMDTYEAEGQHIYPSCNNYALSQQCNNLKLVFGFLISGVLTCLVIYFFTFYWRT